MDWYIQESKIRIFVTGIYAAGKTTLAKDISSKLGLVYVSFDEIHRYGKTTASQVLSMLPDDGFVCDAIPFDRVKIARSSLYEAFYSYCHGRDVEIIVKLTGRDAWLSRDKPSRIFEPDDWVPYHMSNLPDAVMSDASVRFFSDSGEITHKQAVELLDYKGLVLGFANGNDGHDWKYQDAPELGVSGYSDSGKTWAGIQGALKAMGGAGGKTFVDAGSNHGYFCFRLEEAGASCTGLDNHDGALFVSKAIGFLKLSSVRFKGWDAMVDHFPAADCTLILNALHHFGAGCLKNIKSEWLLLEACHEDVEASQEFFEIVCRGESHRNGRQIAIGRKK